MATKRRKSSPNATVLELIEAEAEEASLTGKNRVILMGMKEELADAFARGYKWKVVWKALQKAERIDMSYDTFRNHCRAMGLDIQPKSTQARPAKKKRSRR